MTQLTVTETIQSNWNDAIVFGDLNSDECQTLRRQHFNAICGLSSKQEAGTWRAIDWTLDDFIENILSRHKLKRGKEGEAIVFAEAVKNGERLHIGDTNISFDLCGRQSMDIKNITFAGFDIDEGDLDAAKVKVEEAGIFAIMYTTHSHDRAQTKIKRMDFSGVWSEGQILKFAANKNLGNAEIVEFEDPEEYSEAKAIISHDPLQKFRILFPMQTPFELDIGDAREHARLAEEYRARMCEFATNVLNIEPDETGFDVNRLFYTPRHPKSASNWFIGIYAGRALTLDDMPLPDDYKPRQRQYKRSSETRNTGVKNSNLILSDGFNLLGWKKDFGSRFLATEFFDELGWEFRTGDGGEDEATIECPNDNEHSDSGNPKDVACWVRNGDGEHSFTISCRHNACGDMGPLEMLMQIEEQVELPDGCSHLSELICEAHFYVEISDDEPSIDRLKYIRSAAGSGRTQTFDPQSENENPTPETIEKACKEMLSDMGLDDKYELSGNQLYFLKYVKGKEHPIPVKMCDAFEVLSRTYDEQDGAQGLVIRFAANRKGRPIKEATVKTSQLLTDPNKAIAELADVGFWVGANALAKSGLYELLALIRPLRDVVTATRSGWHNGIFIAPTGQVVGSAETEYRLNEKARIKSHKPSGDINVWKEAVSVALNCENADFLFMGLVSGFVGPLLGPLDESTSPILNFAGTTSRGKTTAQRFGASVWSNPIRDGLLMKFNATINAFEGMAQRISGTLLALDEGGQSEMNGAVYQRAIFKLAEGVGKKRLKSSGEEQDVRGWLACITISEELGFADKVRRDGGNAASGAVARCWEIDVEDAHTLSPDIIAKMKLIEKNFGHAGLIFVQYLFDQNLLSDEDGLDSRFQSILAELPGYEDAPQNRRIAGVAALCILAGELAQEAELIPSEFDVDAAVRRVLMRSNMRMAKDIDPIETALDNLRENLIARIGNDVVSLDVVEENTYRASLAYYGYENADGGFQSESKLPNSERIYFVPARSLFELSGGNISALKLASVLKKDGFVIPMSGKNVLYPSIPCDVGKISHYRIKGTFFHGDDGEE